MLRNARLVVAVIAAVAMLSAPAAGALAAAGAARTHHYPAKVVKSFVATCTKAAKDSSNGKLTTAQARHYCTSALACIESKLSLKQFEQTIKKMQSGARNPKAKVVTACEKAAIKKARK